MNQQWLIDHVLDSGSSIPKAPSSERRYLSLGEAERIVDDTLDDLGANGDDLEYTYMRGHRKRLMHALTMIPKADTPDQSLLDVGCYGYMGLWAKAHLGYERVVGIEWHPENPEKLIRRELRVGEDEVVFDSHNLDISQEDWNLTGSFDTVLFFEVLEHINSDPMGVMERITALMPEGSTLVMSVPNAISYKSLREFLVGMPPWTYWFYQPDLSHEPRHCFEYTPIVFKSLLYASGMEPEAFRTIYAYSSPEHEQDTLRIAELMGCDTAELGETMIAQCTKIRSGISLRYPDVLYSPDGYYKNIYPRLQPILEERLRSHRERVVEIASALPEANIEAKPDSEHADRIRELLEACESQYQRQELLEEELSEVGTQLEQANRDRDQHRDWAAQLQASSQDLRSQVNQLLFQSDCRLQREQELQDDLAAANALKERAERESQETRDWADRLAQENADLRVQVNELLFACDCYLQQVNDPGHCVRVIRQRRFRWALDRSKAVARKTPVVRTALRPVYRSAKRIIKRRM